MTQRSRAEMEANLRSPGPSGAHRSGAGDSDPRARRSGSAEANSGLRIGDGVEIKDGRFKVPLGEGLRIDRRGQVGFASKLEMVNISTNATGVVSAAGGAVLVLPSDIESSIGSGLISVDTVNGWVRLGAGAAYSITAHVVFARAVTSGTVGSSALFVTIRRRDDLLSSDPPYTDIYTANGVELQPLDGQKAVVTIPASAVIDLRSEGSPAAIQVWARSTMEHANFDMMGNIKIERIG